MTLVRVKTFNTPIQVMRAIGVFRPLHQEEPPKRKREQVRRMKRLAQQIVDQHFGGVEPF